jgi:tRNA (cmo5U34)-methyltransferase
MSAASPGAAWQRAELASAFLRERRTVMPLLDVQEDLLRRLLARMLRAPRRFIDLGAGDGAMTELVLSLYPDAEAILVDFSEPMLEGVARRLEGRHGSWQVVRADLSTPSWRASVPAVGYDAVVSALAIHHLPTQRKVALFGELYELLEPGGTFINMDYTLIDGPLRGLWDEQMLANAVRAERERGGRRSQEALERELFDDAEDDRPDSAEDQLRWLIEAGFARAELHFKWAEAAIFSAVKPQGGGR